LEVVLRTVNVKEMIVRRRGKIERIIERRRILEMGGVDTFGLKQMRCALSSFV